MADEPAVDLGELSSSQQEALEQYTAVTNQEIHDAVPLLQRSQWNVQVRLPTRARTASARGAVRRLG